jgi:hypothetical protein
MPSPRIVHTQNQSMAAGTAFAISYDVGFTVLCHPNTRLTIEQSDISKVTMENLTVFTVRYK